MYKILKSKKHKGISAGSSFRIDRKTEMSEVVINETSPGALTGIVGPQRKDTFRCEPMTNSEHCLNHKKY